MTRLIALDTSTWWGGIALVERRDGDNRPIVVAEIGVRARDSHARHLPMLIEHLLTEVGWSKDVDAYVATRGPGSFTGLRVGLGIVRGLSLASGRPSLGVGTLDAMAEAFGPAAADRVPLLDAGRDEVYGARFDADGFPPEPRVEPWLGPPERAVKAPSAVEPPPVMFGSGAEAHRERLRAAGWTGIVGRAPTSVAAAAGRIAAVRLADGAAPGEGMSPLYLRPPDAEKKRRTE